MCHVIKKTFTEKIYSNKYNSDDIIIQYNANFQGCMNAIDFGARFNRLIHLYTTGGFYKCDDCMGLMALRI